MTFVVHSCKNLNDYQEGNPLEKTDVFHNVFKVWMQCGNTVEVEFHNFFPFPRYGAQSECGISVVIVWN